MTVTRETLYDEVWSDPMTIVAKKYEVSSNFLARVCERMNIPRPPRGYWAKTKVGQKIKKESLPELRPGDEIEWSQGGRRKVFMPPPGAPLPKFKREGERPARHQILVGAYQHFEAGRISREGYLKPYKRNIIDMFVTKETLKRALDFASELFLTIEDHGHHVLFQPPSYRQDRSRLKICDEEKTHEYFEHWNGPAPDTVAIINGVAFGLTIFEVIDEYEARWDPILKTRVRGGPPKVPKPGEPFDWRYHHSSLFPTGRLGLRAYAARPHIKWDFYWREKAPGEFKKPFNGFVKDLVQSIAAVEKLIAENDRRNEESRRQHELLKIKWAKEAEERQRVELEASRQKQIVETITNWRLARDVRAYVAGVQALVHDAGLEVTKGGNAESELNWAVAYADRIDPLSSWREDIGRVKAQAAGEPCPKCGKIHRDALPVDPPPSPEAPQNEPA